MANIKLSIADYAVGWICALPEELVAALECLDEEHDNPEDQDTSDENSYSFGRISDHNIVIATLPDSQYGTTSAATVATRMKNQFKALRFGLMVGIGGGVPSPNDICLGDIVISRPNGQNGGVVQYEMGKAGVDGEFLRTGVLNTPPPVLSNALGTLRAKYLRGRSEIPKICIQIEEKLPHFAHPGNDRDNLYKADYPHPSGNATCEKCSKEQLVERTTRPNKNPVLHFGTIASGNQVIKDAKTASRETS